MPNKNFLEIIPQPVEEIHGSLKIAFIAKDALQQQTKEYFYTLPIAYAHTLTGLSDPFLLAILMKAMQTKQDIYVRGKISTSLLRHLHEFQCAWSIWLPQFFSVVKINVEHEVELPSTNHSQSYIAAFSGGVDASFTVWDNLLNQENTHPYPIKGAMMVHGFDIDVSEKEGFERAYKKAKKMTDGLDIPLIPVATNIRYAPWDYVCGAALAACLHLVAGGYRGGIISSSNPYLPMDNYLSGTNPTTDHLLSNDQFAMVHYGATHDRTMKIDGINHWTLARQHLRVCWKSSSDQNCGKCEKCIRTILGFRVNGHHLPECFPHEISDAQIRKLWLGTDGAILEMEEILKYAKERKIKATWVSALEFCIIKSRIGLPIKDKVFGGITPSILRKLLRT